MSTPRPAGLPTLRFADWLRGPRPISTPQAQAMTVPPALLAALLVRATTAAPVTTDAGAPVGDN